MHILQSFCIAMFLSLFIHNKTPKVFCLTFGVHVKAPSSLTKKAYDILTEIPKQEAILKKEILSKKGDFVAALKNAPTDRKNLLKTSIDFMKKSFKLWPEDINTGNPLTKGQVLKNHGADASNVLFQAYSAYSLLNN